MARSAHPANPQRCRVPVSLPAPVPAALGSLRMIARPEKRREQSMSRDKEVPRLNTAIVNCQTDVRTLAPSIEWNTSITLTSRAHAIGLTKSPANGFLRTPFLSTSRLPPRIRGPHLQPPKERE
ncbi:hypothetical protein B2J93_4856 [Marssonina coronariae]|uniref:Uncharacterized protein n=1 Tax=Diplocarpon coronariae TaxID=2795749 RepID=A0A218Z931_9HELO|nr:hypothetical protein B2J93_4856 [Marssonina coronariae]